MVRKLLLRGCWNDFDSEHNVGNRHQNGDALSRRPEDSRHGQNSEESE